VTWLNGAGTILIRWALRCNVGSNPTVTTRMGFSLRKALGPRRATTQAGHNRDRRFDSVTVHMKLYPHIEYWNHGIMDAQIVAFDKLDGQNIRCEWSKNKGWYKFGSRTSMFDESDKQFGQVIPMFKEKYGDALEEIFAKNKNYRNTKNFTVFCEYVGENSFSGRHESGDVMDVVLFDVASGDHTNNSFVEPKDFIKDFRGVHIPKIIYQGKLTEEFINKVRVGEFGVKEGVMCKGVMQDGTRRVWIVKIKTSEWLEKLKANLGEAALKEELNGDLSLL
jgi:hypothetical protein